MIRAVSGLLTRVQRFGASTVEIVRAALFALVLVLPIQASALTYYWEPVYTPSNGPPPLLTSPEEACINSYQTIYNDSTRPMISMWVGPKNSTCSFKYPSSMQVLQGAANLRCSSGYIKVPYYPYCEVAPSGAPLEPAACQMGNPIEVATGLKTTREADFATSDGKLYFERLYATTSGQSGPLGFRWMSNFDRVFTYSSQYSTAEITLGDGRIARFKWVVQTSQYRPMYPAYNNGVYFDSWQADKNKARTSVAWKLENISGGGWKFIDEDGRVEIYDASGKIQSITFPGGYSWTYAYSGSLYTSVTDTYGRSILFAYTALGFLNSVTAPDGGIYRYTFSSPTFPYPVVDTTQVRPPYAVLNSVTYPDSTPTLTDNPMRNYLYEDTNSSTLLTGITDERGIRVRTYSYNGVNRGISTQYAGGVNQYSFSINDSNNTTTVTSPLGRVATFATGLNSDNLRKINSITEAASANAPSLSRSFLYDSNNFLSQVTDAEGRVTKYLRNTRGLETSRTEGFGTTQARTITTSWSANFAIPSQIVEPGLTIDATVDTAGKVTQVKKTDTTSQSIPYSTNGQQRITDYAYTTSGLLDTVDGPLSGSSDLTNYDYTTDGFLSQITDAAGHITSVTSLDGAGRPLTVLDENGVITAIAYTPRGWVASITVKPGATQRVTAFEYDAAGHVTKITRPQGGTLIYTYDNAERVTKIENNFGETVNFTYNNAGLVTARTVKSAATTITQNQTMVYDEIGRLLQKIGANSETETRGYDKEDNLTSITDPRSKLYSKAYDPINRLITETNPDSQSDRYVYNGKSELVGQKDGRTLETTYVRNGFGDVIRETSPDRGVTDYWYDAAGRVTKVVDAASVEVNYTYDLIDRMLTKTFPGSSALNQTFTYDSTASGNKGVGLLTSLSDGYGSASYVYDEFGGLITESRTTGTHTYLTAYEYDSDGALTQITYPSGRQVRYVRDNQNRITAVDTRASSGGSWVSTASSVSWKPYGPLAALTFGNGLNLTLGYDQNYWLTAIDTAQGGTSILDLDIGRNADGRVATIADNLISSRNEAYAYTNSARLQSASGAWGSKSWTYDAAGNRTAETKVVSGVTTNDVYNYGSTSNRLNSLYTDPSGTTLKRSFSYRANGQTSQDVRVGDGTYDYVYKSDGRLSEVKKASATLAVYGYDADGRRVTRAVTGGITRDYVYSASGRLLSEADASGATVRDYLWLEDLPLAVVDSGTTYYVHAGQRGEPLAMTDASKTKVWDAVVEPFGAAQVFTSTVAMDRRLPGQDLQAETSLSQNGQRDYDPALGRYIEPDPIGLDGGPHVYSYVGQDPLTYVDPEGLDVWLEGPNPSEPYGHQSINVGDPRGAYDSYSYGANGNGLQGEVYRDPETGGPIEAYKYTTPKEDALFKAWLEAQVGMKSTYGWDDICRSWSQRAFNRAKGRVGLAPLRASVPTKRTPLPSRSTTTAGSTTGTSTSR